MKWAWLGSALLIGAALVGSAHGQEKQHQQGMTQRQQQDQSSARNRSPFPDDMLEDLLVIRMAERSNLSGVTKVDVNEGVATLSGKVPDETAKRRALQIARQTAGIMSVRDQLKIDSSMTRAISERERNVNEKELVQQVAKKIAASIEGAKAGEDWWFEGWRVEGPFNTWNLVIEVDERGFVNLEGDVPNLDIMRKAVEAAAQVPGVRAVDTDMELERYYAGYGYPYGYYPYAYFPYGYHPYYGPHAFAPYAWHPPVSFESQEQPERQAAASSEAQQQGR